MMGWRTSFLAQARSDFDMLSILLDKELNKRQRISDCHKLHYLQMCAEKLAKGFSTDEKTKPRPVHNALVRFIQTSKSNKGLMKTCGYKDVKYFQEYLKSLIEIAEKVEDLVPIGKGERLNPEYPWQDASSGTIFIPAKCNYRDHDSRLDFKNPK